MQYVRKEFRPHAAQTTDYEDELRNLSILNHVGHAHIVELLSAYTFRGSHNLIFPLARDGDLADFLQKERPREFQSDEKFVIALAQLASAIEEVHNFSAETLDLNLIGCHHDLKPKNILVDGANFFLADFGLSRLKDTSETSKTLFKRGQGDYLAPECEDIDGSFARHIVRRSSDVWSFGCIIAEILTYMVLGVGGVGEFRNRRRYRLGNFIYYHFHYGPDQQNREVVRWLSDLPVSNARMHVQLLSLIRSMLSVKADKRPRAPEITARLRMIGLDAIAQSISADYEKLTEKHRSIEALIEQARFRSWTRTCGFCDVDKDPKFLTSGFQVDFQFIVNTLREMQEVLANILTIGQSAPDSMLLPLRHLNNRIRDLLPVSMQHDIQASLQHSLIHTQDISILSMTQDALNDRSEGERVVTLARIKFMTVLAMERSDLHTDLRIDPQHLENFERLVDFELALLKDGGDEAGLQVLVEWMHYDSPLVDEQKGRERMIRVEAIAELLSSTDKPEDFRVLQCCGFFHNEDGQRYGLVSQYPRSSIVEDSKMEELKAITLGNIIDDSESRTKRMPALEDRFKLAHALAVSIVEFHRVKWLQRAISSFHVVFFPPEYSSVPDYIAQPYIVGFNHSRPDEPCAFTEGPGQGSGLQDYQHPHYQQNRSRYRPGFDYYSLGIVLLEIGLWASLANITVNG